MPVDWTALGSITVGPNDLSRVVGSFEIGEGDDTIWIDVQALQADSFWPWSYGILSWKTDYGYELGSTKAYTENPGEIFRLGVGRPPRSRTGVLIYEPRSFNLGWIKKGNDLTLSFEASSGTTSGGGGGGGGSGGGGGGGDAAVSLPVVGGEWVYNTNGLTNLKL